MGTELVAPSWPVLTAPEVASILSDLAPDPVIEWVSPRPFSAAALVRTAEKTLFVKRHHSSVRTVAELLEEHAFMAHLAERGIPVPTALRTTAVGEWTYEVHTVGTGVDLYRDAPSWTPLRNIEHAASAGRFLGRAHRAAADFTAPQRQTGQLIARFDALNSPDPMNRFEQLVQARPVLRDALADRPWREDIARLVLPWHATLAPYLAELEPLWTHNDWHASNLLWSEDTPSSVIDFGLANRTTAIFDLATALERNTIQWLNPGDPTVHLDHAGALIEGYLTEASLTPSERAALGLLLPIVHVEFALSELEYFHGITGSAADAELAYDDYLIGHIHWFNSPTGQRYLTECKSTHH